MSLPDDFHENRLLVLRDWEKDILSEQYILQDLYNQSMAAYEASGDKSQLGQAKNLERRIRVLVKRLPSVRRLLRSLEEAGH